MKELKFVVDAIYNRKVNLDKDYTTAITVLATCRAEAIRKVNDYEVRGMFDRLENDYIEDSLYAV